MINIEATGISETVIQTLEKQGIPIRRQLNIDLPTLPDDITAVDDQELMRLANVYMQYYSFMLTQVTAAELAVLEVENEYDMAEAKAMLGKTTGKTTEKSIMLRAHVLTDPEMQELSRARLQAQAYHKLLKTTLDNLERSYQLTSRELTRRTSVLKARGY
jgi:hypothetical protein